MGATESDRISRLEVSYEFLESQLQEKLDMIEKSLTKHEHAFQSHESQDRKSFEAIQESFTELNAAISAKNTENAVAQAETRTTLKVWLSGVMVATPILTSVILTILMYLLKLK